jgi:hypothetical protein
MRLIVFLISLLCGCSAPMVRCDARLKPINLPAAGPAAAAASAVGGVATEVSGTTDSAGGPPPSRSAP